MKDGTYVILCVDDDPDILDTLRTVLVAAGYEVVLAASGEDGLRLYKQHRPDFIIADLMMEEVDAGTRFAKELKALGNKAPFYMLSSIGDQMNVTVDPTELGVDGIFQKPIDFKLLRDTIATKLKGHA